MALTCYLDAFSGISGDMTVWALADAGADRDAVASAIHSLQVGATVSFESVKRQGIGATKFRVAVEETRKHRHLPQIVKMIEAADISPRARRDAIAIFQRLGEAEARTHQVPIEKVHFHEVGAADSIADIVGAAVAFDSLGVDEVFCSAVNVGSGTVATEHGIVPVPAPATARLLEQAPVYSQGPSMELTTPTGAAIAATLSTSFGALPPLRIVRTGYGAGDRDFPGQANVLRVILGEPSGATEAQTVCVLEANIDDSNAQVLAYALERLMAAGALDVTLQPIVMKKGRPGTLLRAIANPQDREALSSLIFQETSTLGLRIFTAERRVQPRTWTEVATPYGKVRVKVGGDGTYAPEYEDCKKAALESGAPLKKVIAEANYAYLNLSR